MRWQRRKLKRNVLEMQPSILGMSRPQYHREGHSNICIHPIPIVLLIFHIKDNLPVLLNFYVGVMLGFHGKKENHYLVTAKALNLWMATS